MNKIIVAAIGSLGILVVGFPNALANVSTKKTAATKIDPVTVLMRSIEHPPNRQGTLMVAGGVKYDCHATHAYSSETHTAVDFRCWQLK